MAETSGVLDYAIVKISDTNLKAAREFMEAFEVNMKHKFLSKRNW